MLRALSSALVNLFSKPVTRNYPAEKIPKAERYRGQIVWEKEKCIACFICEKSCPSGALLFVQNPDTGEVAFNFNSYQCIYCGECVRGCPDKSRALSQSESLAEAGIAADRINERWKAVEKEAEASKLEYRARKKTKLQ